MARRIALSLLVLLTLAVPRLAVAASSTVSGEEAGIGWRSCHIGGLAEAIECLTVDVPLDWAQPSGDKITIHAAVIRALDGSKSADPLFVLAGGPGQAAMDYGALIDTAFADVRKTRDIVLMDQRGAGHSNPLQCALPNVAFAAVDLDSLSTQIEDCAENASADVRHFTSADVIQDIERLRAVLEVETLNLWGGSFGTRLAQHYVRDYPQRVRAVVLDAALPAGHSLFASAPASSQAAWDRLVTRCHKDFRCRERFPNLDRTLVSLLQRIARHPGQVALVDPTLGVPTSVRVDRDLVSETIRGALYVPRNAALLPYAVSEAEAGRFEPLAALAHDTSAWAGETMFLGVTLSILCSEEVPALTPANAASAAGDAFVRDTYHRFWRAACRHWPRKPLPPRFFDGIESDIPALILSGGADPVTPPSLGDQTARGFGNVTHAIAPAAGHTISMLGCSPELIGRFLEQPRANDFETDCLQSSISSPPFALGPLGPDMQGDLQ